MKKNVDSQLFFDIDRYYTKELNEVLSSINSFIKERNSKNTMGLLLQALLYKTNIFIANDTQNYYDRRYFILDNNPV